MKDILNVLKQGVQYMKISAKTQMDGESLSQRDLLTYLSQVVLSKTDEEIEMAALEAGQAKRDLTEAKKKLKAVKTGMNRLLIEHQRFKIMLSVLQKIDTLRKEGVIVGENKMQVRKILTGIEGKSIRQLKSLEDKLSSYVPESPKISYG